MKGVKNFAISMILAVAIIWIAASFMCRIAPQAYGDNCAAPLPSQKEGG